MRRLTATLMLLLPLSAHALPEFDALYDFERGRITVGETRMSLERTTDNIYRYESRSEAVGIISVFVDDVIREESVFHYDGSTFWPVSYEYRHEGSKKNRDQRIAYDWTDRIARVNYRGHHNEVKLSPGVVDRFLLQLAISTQVRDESLSRKYRVIDNGEVKEYQLESSQTEKVRTPAGDFTALRVERADNSEDKKLRMWLAPELGYLPVLVEHEKRNEEPLRLVLKKIDLPDAAGEASR